MGMLVALLLLFVLALRSSVVTFVASLSSTLVIVIGMVFINNSGVMSNNTRMMIAGLLLLMAVGSCDTAGLSCHDNEDHHVVDTRCDRSPDQAWQHRTQVWQREGKQWVSS